MPLANRTIFSGDNLPILYGMDDACVDLIYLDPPFNSNRNYSAPIGSKAAGAAFKDAWTLEDTDDSWWGLIAKEHPGLYKVIDAAGEVGGDGDKAYLIYMAIRLLEMHRALKDTGSLYLHCDPTMSHSLKLLLDAVFGKDGFRNEIVWFYPDTPGRSKRWFPKKHDVLLFFSKTKEWRFNADDVRVPILEKSKNRYSYDRTLAGITKKGGSQSGDEGKIPESVWRLPSVKGNSREGTGYPTQKPLALLERIIKASSNPGDIILDPFCGCATTCVAAEKLERQWVGIDISDMAVRLVKDRMRREINLGDEEIPALLGAIIHRTDIPVRNAPKPSRDIKQVLFGKQRGMCNGCKTHFPYQNFTKDHIIPTARGGANTDANLQLLCNFCNSLKGSRYTMAELHAMLRRRALLADGP